MQWDTALIPAETDLDSTYLEVSKVAHSATKHILILPHCGCPDSKTCIYLVVSLYLKDCRLYAATRTPESVNKTACATGVESSWWWDSNAISSCNKVRVK